MSICHFVSIQCNHIAPFIKRMTCYMRKLMGVINTVQEQRVKKKEKQCGDV